MNEKEVLAEFQKEGALLSGHFLLSSGLHSPNYLQCALVLQKPKTAEKLCAALAKKISCHVDVVVGPALGGVVVSYEMARALGVRSLFAERLVVSRAEPVNGELVLRRGFTFKKNDKVLVVEDVVTTGKSTREVFKIVEAEGARVVGVACIVDRSEGKADFNVPLFSVLKVDVKTFEARECPLCQEGKIPAVKPGSRT